MDLSRGIAVAGIWIGVGLSSLLLGPLAVFIAYFAVFATLFISGE